MDYNYSLTGSNQSQFSYLDKSTQLDALSSLMKTLEADFLAIPKDKLELFPPRAFGYPRTRESFKSNLGPAFDPFSASETSADMTLSLILRPKRLNRLIYQHALDNSNLSLNELYDYISEKTIFLNNSSNLSRDDSYLNEIQHIVNLTLLKRIFSVINDESSSFQVKSISNDFLNKLSREFSSKKNRNLKLSKYSDYYLKMIRDFERNPKAYKSNIPLKIPDGSPIGMDNCNLHQLK